MLTRIVLWWSAFTMLTGAARGFQSLVAIRFLFGAGEAGAFPNIARSFSRWFPARERGRANGVMFLGSRMGGMLSAPVALLHRRALGLAHELRDLRLRRHRLGGGVVRVVPRSAGGASGGRRATSSRGSSRTAAPAPTRGAGTPWRALLAQPQSLCDLRDVLRVRLRPLLLLHLAADLPDQGARLLAARRRPLRGAAVPARRHRRSSSAAG